MPGFSLRLPPGLSRDRRALTSLEYAFIAGVIVATVLAGFSSMGSAISSRLANLAPLSQTTVASTTDSGTGGDQTASTAPASSGGAAAPPTTPVTVQPTAVSRTRTGHDDE